MTGPREGAADFDALFTGFYRRLARLLYRVTGDTARAEEVASEAFWRLHAKPPASESNLEGWLYRTGLRLALDQLKKDRRRARYESLAAVFGLAPSPLQVLERAEETARVRRVLGALKVDQVALILLRADGLTYSELASALHLNPASVGTMLSRAEQAFRKEYVKRYGQPRT
ncbi:MAG: RNA polymerase subunit sigma-24 [Proteobacteria bacterium]|nr:MAG: RNA polymerase subunit sigma-24 [Pseudomonadota bacterium]